MITERDLMEAIAECEGQRNPNSATCIKLAAFYTIRRELFGAEPEEAVIPRGFSGAPAPAIEPLPGVVVYDSGSAFSEAIKGKDMHRCLAVLDEMMETLQVISPRLYDGVMRKLNEI